ncbi:centriolin isoform X5 [Neoarius graeffei]|uniref:centriolin isoform X5 n=1 Tax=Neoarius graeffei TaxID=443677 RepID=UPI00298D2978|nr:centriolin isoform X5 [Neoarius graeffei]
MRRISDSHRASSVEGLKVSSKVLRLGRTSAREDAAEFSDDEELERLEQELEERGAEMEQLQREKAVALKKLEHQEKLQQSLRQQSQEQQQEQLEMELDTNSELDLEGGDVLGESPYIGKARHKRNAFTSNSVDAGNRHLATGGLMHTDKLEENKFRHDVARVHAVTVAEEQLQHLHKEMEYTERQILRASKELQQLEEAASQKRASETEKDHLRQQLHMKIQKLCEMRQEAETLEKQLDRQSSELSEAQEELDQLQSLLHTLKPEDLRYAHVKAQLASKNQLLSIMSRKQHELEGRLDDMLSCITKETREIKDLEQQLTEGQIAANEALKKDLEGIISGLQDYLYGVKDQARQAQSDCLRMQKEKDTLQQLLWDKDQQLNQLLQVAQICENTKEDLLQHQEELQALQRENAELREAQVQGRAREAKLEAQLRERDSKVNHLKEELSRLQWLSHLEHSALQAELQKERQAKENALAQLQLAAESELENTDLLQQLNTLQREKGTLMEKVSVLQKDLQQIKRELLCPKQVAKSLQGLKRILTTGSGELSRLNGDGDVLSESLAELQEELQRTVSAALRDRDEAWSARERLACELGVVRNRLMHYQQKYQSAWEEAQQARTQQETERHEEEAELLLLREELQEVQEQQYLTLQRLQEAERVRDRLLLEFEKQDKQVKAGEALTQEQLQSLKLELRELRRFFSTADQLAAEQLKAAKDQLRSLHSTVQRISQERAEDAEELEESRMQAAQAMQDLTKAEATMQVLQKLLQDRISDTDVPPSSVQHQELARLNQVLKKQLVQMKRLQEQLAQALEDNSGDLDELIEEMEALRNVLLQQSNYLSRFGCPPQSSGYWYYVSPYQNSYSLREADHSLSMHESGRVASGQVLGLEEQRSKLQMELKELQGVVSQPQRHKRLLESSLGRAEENTVMDEVKDLKKTLLKRRTELREIDRLLSEAEADLKDTRAKTKYTLQRYSKAERQFKETECELEEVKQQTQDSTRQLVNTKQQLRDLQEEVKDLQRFKQDQITLKQMEKMISARDAEIQEVNRTLERVTKKMEDMQKELREAQQQKANIFMDCRDSEDILHTHRKEVDHLNTQVLQQKEQLSLLGQKLEQWREEEDIVRANVEKHRQCLVEVLRQGEEDAHSLQHHIKELRGDVQSLAVQKGELDSQLSERRRRLAQYKKEEMNVQERVRNQHAVINKHKAELKHILEMIQLESVELERVKVQHNQKLDELEKSQEALLQVRLEVHEVKKELQEQQAERERNRELQEQEILALKEQTNAAAIERSSLLEQCTSMEACRSHTHRCQETAEEGLRKAEAELLKLQAELTELKQEHRHAQSIREEITRDAATTQQQLEEKSKDLNKLKEDIAHATVQIEKIRKEVEDAQQEQDDFVKQYQHQKALMQDKILRRQQRINKMEQQLKEIEASVEKKEMQLERQEERLMIQQQQSLELEELQRKQQQKLQSQLQALEEVLSKRVEKMEQVTVVVEELEERRHFLLADQQQCALLQDRVAQLEQDLAESEARLCASTEEQKEAKEELETCHSDIQILQGSLAIEREHAEALINCSLTDRDKLQQAELWSQQEGESHMQEIKDTVCSLRAEVQVELDRGLKEFELQPMTASHMDNDKENHTSATLNMGKTAYSNRDEQCRGEVLREKLRQHEDNLKAQLRRCMFSQQEALSLRRQQTEGSIQGLRRRVDKLDQLLTMSGHDFSYLNDSNILPKYTRVCRPNEITWDYLSQSDTERCRQRRERERSFSPIMLDPTIPEKD